jgi:hypothetical protein
VQQTKRLLGAAIHRHGIEGSGVRHPLQALLEIIG